MSRERFRMYIEKAEAAEVVVRGERIEERISIVREMLSLINENTQVFRGRFEVEVSPELWLKLRHNRDKLRGVWPLDALATYGNVYRVWYTPVK